MSEKTSEEMEAQGAEAEREPGEVEGGEVSAVKAPGSMLSEGRAMMLTLARLRAASITGAVRWSMIGEGDEARIIGTCEAWSCEVTENRAGTGYIAIMADTSKRATARSPDGVRAVRLGEAYLLGKTPAYRPTESIQVEDLAPYAAPPRPAPEQPEPVRLNRGAQVVSLSGDTAAADYAERTRAGADLLRRLADAYERGETSGLLVVGKMWNDEEDDFDTVRLFDFKTLDDLYSLHGMAGVAQARIADRVQRIISGE